MAPRQNPNVDLRTLARKGAIHLIRTIKQEFPGILTDVQREEQIARAAHARQAKQTREK